MKAAQIKKYGGKEVVEVNEVPVSAVASGRLVVEVHAAGVNPADWKIQKGYFAKMAPLEFPATLGMDFSGVVTKVGEGVSRFKVGDEVFGQAGVLNGGSGSFAEFALADIKTVTPKPKKMSHLESAALPLVGVSALQALTEHINLKKGQKILVHGGAGGIGTIAIQLAKHLGAYVATTARAEDASYVKELGADEVIDYTKQSFENILSGYDAVFDTVGGETYTKSFKVLKKGGVIVSMLEKANADLMKQYGVTAISQSTDVNSERLAKLAELANQEVLKIEIDKTFPLDSAGEALEYLETGHTKGKVVLKIK